MEINFLQLRIGTENGKTPLFLLVENFLLLLYNRQYEEIAVYYIINNSAYLPFCA